MSATITCKHCGARVALCGHVAADLVTLAEVREENARLRETVADMDRIRTAAQRLYDWYASDHGGVPRPWQTHDALTRWSDLQEALNHTSSHGEMPR